MTQGHVDNDEEIYRRVPVASGGGACYGSESGQLVFHLSAFNDVANSPSVDRANKREFDPHRTRFNPQDGVVALKVASVRQLEPVQKFDERQRVVSEHTVDVVYDPIFSNCAHALITGRPTIPGNAFRRLKERLVRLANDAGWRVVPGAPLPRRKRIAVLRETLQCVLQRLREILLRSPS